MRRFLLFSIILFCVIPISAQKGVIMGIDTTSYPTVDVEAFFFDESGQPFTPPVSEIVISEQQEAKQVLDINCASDLTKAPKRDLIFMFEANSSNSSADVNEFNKVIDDFSEMFTNRRTAVMIYNPLPTVIKDLGFGQPELGDRDFDFANKGYFLDSAFHREFRGLFPMMEKWEPNNPIVIIIGKAKPVGDEQRLEDSLEVFNTELHLVFESEGSESFYNLVTRRDGIVVDNLPLAEALRTLLARIHYPNLQACRLSYSSSYSCDQGERLLELSLAENEEESKSSRLFQPGGQGARLEFSPRILDFGEVAPGETKNLTLTVTALAGEYGDITLSSSEPYISLNPSVIQLGPGDSQDITVSFTPQDSTIRFADILFENEICPQATIAGGGFEASPERYSIELTKPEGGERLLTGTDTLIEYQNVGNAQVDLLLSRDDGQSWEEIDKNVFLSPYDWKSIKGPSTDLARIMAKVDLGFGYSFKDFRAEWQGQEGRLNDIAYSPNDSILAVASDYVVILDGESAEPLDTLGGANDVVFTIEFSPDGREIAGGTIDGDIIIWNLATGEIRERFDGQHGWVTDILYWDGGSKIIASYADAVIRVHDTSNLTISEEIQGHSNRVMALTINPTGEFLLSVAEDSRALIHNTASWTELESVNFPISIYFGLVFAQDNSYAAFTSLNNIYIYNPLDWSQPEYVIESAPNKNYTGVYFDPKGNALVAISLDGYIHAWEKGTWEEIENYEGHVQKGVSVGNPFSITGTSNGKKIATTGDDGRAVIWGGLFNTIITDTSDVFSIIEPSLTADAIDMGTIAIGGVSTKTIQDFVVGETDPYLIIDSMAIVGGDALKFEYLEEIDDTRLNVGDILNQTFVFSSDTEGLFNSTVSIFYHGKWEDIAITGRAVPPLLEAIDVVDFGLREKDIRIDSTVIAAITNNGDVAVSIADLELTGQNPGAFEIVNSPLGETLEAGESIDLEISFLANKAGSSSAVLEIKDATIGVTERVYIYGETPVPLLYGNIIDNHGAPGETVDISIQLENHEQYLEAYDSISLSLSYNATVLTYIGDRYTQISDGDQSKLLLNILASDIDDTGIFSFPVYVALGNEEIITLEGRDESQRRTESIIEDGQFRLDSLCYDSDGPRLFTSTAEAGIESVSPNPADESAMISYSVIERGMIILTLYDKQGRLINEVVKEIHEPGTYSLELDVSTLATGLYYLRYTSRTINYNYIIAVE